MNRFRKAVCMAAGALLLAVPALAETASHEGQGQAVVTVLPKRNRETPANVTLQDVQVKIGRGEAAGPRIGCRCGGQVTSWRWWF